MTRRELVEQLLQDAGPSGVTTSQFLKAGAGSRFGARVQELRNEGYTITCHRVRDGEFCYVLDAEGGGSKVEQREVSPASDRAAAPLSAQLFELPPPEPRRYGEPEAA